AVGQAAVPDSVEVRQEFQEEFLAASVDAVKLRRALENLIKNAVEASEDKPVSVDIGMDRDCRISISNAGLVPLSIQPRFFEKYATEGKRGGTGLGTYSARLVAEKHGGSIAMCSAPDTGTTVSVRIPREQPDSATARLRHSENQSG
ncbi:MAG: hypothetical protein KKD85_11560, partial [Proteobacteria bacterium]|nr:hypothetical protein [Pseudomonadota bacterium]